MAQSKKYPEPTTSVDRQHVLAITSSLLDLDQQISELKEERKEYSAEAREKAIHAQAHALALKLAKMLPSKRLLFLECFDDLRVKLALDEHQTAVDSQADLEDAIKQRSAA